MLVCNKFYDLCIELPSVTVKVLVFKKLYNVNYIKCIQGSCYKVTQQYNINVFTVYPYTPSLSSGFSKKPSTIIKKLDNQIIMQRMSNASKQLFLLRTL